MGLRGPRSFLTDVVMNEVEEAEESLHAMIAVVVDSIADGQITADEVIAIRTAADRTRREVRDVVQVAEDAVIADHLADNIKRGGVTPFVRRRAEARGWIVPLYPDTEPRDAA